MNPYSERCKYCSQRLIRTAQQDLTSVSDKFLKTLSAWIRPTPITREDHLCKKCFYKVRNAVELNEKLPICDYKKVCLVCGIVLSQNITKIDLQQNSKERKVIEKWIFPHLIPYLDKVCQSCFAVSEEFTKPNEAETSKGKEMQAEKNCQDSKKIEACEVIRKSPPEIAFTDCKECNDTEERLKRFVDEKNKSHNDKRIELKETQKKDVTVSNTQDKDEDFYKQAIQNIKQEVLDTYDFMSLGTEDKNLAAYESLLANPIKIKDASNKNASIIINGVAIKEEPKDEENEICGSLCNITNCRSISQFDETHAEESRDNIDSAEEENDKSKHIDGDFDAKLELIPTVNTIKLDYMKVFKDKNYNHVRDRTVIESAVLENEPPRKVIKLDNGNTQIQQNSIKIITTDEQDIVNKVIGSGNVDCTEKTNDLSNINDPQNKTTTSMLFKTNMKSIIKTIPIVNETNSSLAEVNINEGSNNTSLSNISKSNDFLITPDGYKTKIASLSRITKYNRFGRFLISDQDIILNNPARDANKVYTNKKKRVTSITQQGDGDISDPPKVNINHWMFKKPRVKSYNPRILRKNPDFNTHLKELNFGFFESHNNIEYLKLCVPVTIDLHKSFEDKLVNNTIYLDVNSPTDDSGTEKLFINVDNRNTPVAVKNCCWCSGKLNNPNVKLMHRCRIFCTCCCKQRYAVFLRSKLQNDRLKNDDFRKSLASPAFAKTKNQPNQRDKTIDLKKSIVTTTEPQAGHELNETNNLQSGSKSACTAKVSCIYQSKPMNNSPQEIKEYVKENFGVKFPKGMEFVRLPNNDLALSVDEDVKLNYVQMVHLKSVLSAIQNKFGAPIKCIQSDKTQENKKPVGKIEIKLNEKNKPFVTITRPNLPNNKYKLFHSLEPNTQNMSKDNKDNLHLKTLTVRKSLLKPELLQRRSLLKPIDMPIVRLKNLLLPNKNVIIQKAQKTMSLNGRKIVKVVKISRAGVHVERETNLSQVPPPKTLSNTINLNVDRGLNDSGDEPELIIDDEPETEKTKSGNQENNKEKNKSGMIEIPLASKKTLDECKKFVKVMKKSRAGLHVARDTILSQVYPPKTPPSANKSNLELSLNDSGDEPVLIIESDDEPEIEKSKSLNSESDKSKDKIGVFEIPLASKPSLEECNDRVDSILGL